MKLLTVFVSSEWDAKISLLLKTFIIVKKKIRLNGQKSMKIFLFGEKWSLDSKDSSQTFKNCPIPILHYIK